MHASFSRAHLPLTASTVICGRGENDGKISESIDNKEIVDSNARVVAAHVHL